MVLNGARVNPGIGRWPVSLARWASLAALFIALVARVSRPGPSILKLSSRSVKTDLDDGAGGTMALVVAWPVLWDFSHSPRLTDAALLPATQSLDEPVITGLGLYRRDPVAAAPGGRR
ncbi:hypothetical protein J4G37_24120 [Microvirga sp. 3-52]|nr:hypothetical protein [Microvirga sp. 3-52]